MKKALNKIVSFSFLLLFSFIAGDQEIEKGSAIKKIKREDILNAIRYEGTLEILWDRTIFNIDEKEGTITIKDGVKSKVKEINDYLLSKELEPTAVYCDTCNTTSTVLNEDTVLKLQTVKRIGSFLIFHVFSKYTIKNIDSLTYKEINKKMDAALRELAKEVVTLKGIVVYIEANSKTSPWYDCIVENGLGAISECEKYSKEIPDNK